MNAGALTFLLFLGALGLSRWKPQTSANTALRMLIWGLLSFLSSVALLFSLFTVWWPPTQVWAVVWSSAAVVVLLVIIVSNTQPADWQS